MRFIAIVVFSLAVFSTSRCAHQEPPTLEELEKFVETLGGSLYQNDEGEVLVVSLDGSQVTDAELAHLTGLRELERLSLYSTQVTDAGLVHLAGLTTLEALYLDATQVTETAAAELEKTLPNIRFILVTDGPLEF
jgi:hypothetical protein